MRRSVLSELQLCGLMFCADVVLFCMFVYLLVIFSL